MELDSLDKEDFIRILTEPNNALIKQYREMMATEGIDMVFTDDAVAEIAEVAETVNEKTENIGARRLYTVMEKLLEEVAFDAGSHGKSALVVGAAYVDARLKDLAQSQDLARYVL